MITYSFTSTDYVSKFDMFKEDCVLDNLFVFFRKKMNITNKIIIALSLTSANTKTFKHKY